jgi:transcriptional antiterminator RfaH
MTGEVTNMAVVSTSARWYVFQSRHKSEFFAEHQLNRQGYDTWVPYEMVDRTRMGVVVGQEKRALFRSYGFVRFDIGTDHWRPICSSYGIKRLFSTTPDKPIALPRDVIESLQFAMLGLVEPDQDIVVEPVVEPVVTPDPLPVPSFALGDGAEVLTGIFAGRTGIVQSTSSSRVVLLMDILHGQVSVKFKLVNVTKTETV